MTLHRIIEALDVSQISHETIKYACVDGKAVHLELLIDTLQKETEGDIVNKSIMLFGPDWYLHYKGDWIVDQLPMLPTENLTEDLHSVLFTKEDECVFVHMDNRPK